MQYLSRGQVCPPSDKTAAMEVPKTNKEGKQFLAMTGYYWRFVPNFSDVTSLLTDLTLSVNPLTGKRETNIAGVACETHTHELTRTHNHLHAEEHEPELDDMEV